MRLADAPVLPFEFGRLVSTIRRYADEIEGIPTVPRRPDLAPVRNELLRLQQSAAALESSYQKALPNLASSSPEKLAALNRLLFRTERSLVIDPGLPDRPWYRHRLYAPGKYTGYDAKTLPGIREAVEAGKQDEARQQAAQVVQVLHDLTGILADAQKILGEL
jgi:N-acetylated-alpha-linked acidic dipeptidase